jgi:hypothetical protein
VIHRRILGASKADYPGSDESSSEELSELSSVGGPDDDNPPCSMPFSPPVSVSSPPMSSSNSPSEVFQFGKG